MLPFDDFLVLDNGEVVCCKATFIIKLFLSKQLHKTLMWSDSKDTGCNSINYNKCKAAFCYNTGITTVQLLTGRPLSILLKMHRMPSYLNPGSLSTACQCIQIISNYKNTIKYK